MLVFVKVGKPENPEKNPWSKVRANTNSSHNMDGAEIKLGQHWWEGSALTSTAPSLLPKYLTSF